MSQELQLGKYEFYTYGFEAGKAPTLEELREMLRKAKAKSGNDIKMPLRSIGHHRPRRKRHG